GTGRASAGAADTPMGTPSATASGTDTPSATGTAPSGTASAPGTASPGAGGLAVAVASASAAVAQYDKLELRLALAGSVASAPELPYDPAPPPGLAGRVGLTVEGLFLPPGAADWGAALVQPAFLYQDYE